MPKKKAETPANVTGFRVKPRYRDVTCTWYELEEGEEPFTATIRRNLTFEELEAIPRGEDLKWSEVWPVIAPYVVAWNHTKPDAETGEVVAVPPPAEAGPEVFRTLDTEMNLWLLGEVRYAHIGGPAALVKHLDTDRKKEPMPSESTPEPAGGKN